MELNQTNRPITEAPVDSIPEASVPTPEDSENATVYVPKQTQEEVIKRLSEINEDACNADKQEIDILKQTFYKLHKADQEAAKKNLWKKEGIRMTLFLRPTRSKNLSKK